MHGAPLRGPERSAGRVEALCGASKPPPNPRSKRLFSCFRLGGGARYWLRADGKGRCLVAFADGATGAGTPLERSANETRARSYQARALPNQTRALSSQTWALSSQTRALFNRTRALSNQTRALGPHPSWFDLAPSLRESTAPSSTPRPTGPPLCTPNHCRGWLGALRGASEPASGHPQTVGVCAFNQMRTSCMLLEPAFNTRRGGR